MYVVVVIHKWDATLEAVVGPFWLSCEAAEYAASMVEYGGSFTKEIREIDAPRKV